MTSNQRKSVLIMGGGLAGLASAVLLDELGYEVTLLEKKNVLGGRTFSFTDKQTGLAIDNGQHLMVGAYHETIALIEKVGVKHKIAYQVPTIVPLVLENGRVARFRLGGARPPFNLILALLGFSGFGVRDKVALARLGLTLRRMLAGQVPLPANLTVTQWLRSLGQSEFAIRNFWDVLTLATLNDAPSVASADALATVLLRSYFGGARDGQLVLPKASLAALFGDAILRYLHARGQAVRTGVGVKEIRVLNGRVQAVTTSTGETLKADYYVSALPPHRLLNVLPGPFVDATPALRALRDFEYAPIVSINLFFDVPVLDGPLVGSAAARVHWFFDRNAIEAVQRDVYHVTGVVSGAYDFLNMDKVEIVRIAREDLRRISPRSASAGLMHSLVNIERQATLSCRVGVNAQRPHQKIFDNFFLAGDWTRTGLPPTIESAVVSARLLRDALAR